MRKAKTNKKATRAVVSLLVCFAIHSSVQHVTLALYADEAGLNDFKIATTGHGPVKSAWFATPEVLITSSSLPPERSFQKIYSNTADIVSKTSPCYVAGRSASTGNLLWRHNVCTAAAANTTSFVRHSTAVLQGKDSSAVVTLDDQGILQKWDPTSGSLQWNIKLWQFSTASATIQTSTHRLFPWKENDAVIAVSYRYVDSDTTATRKEGLTIHSLHDGHPMYLRSDSSSSEDEVRFQPLVIYAQDLLKDIRMPSSGNSNPPPRIIAVRALNNRQLHILAGYVPESSTLAATSQIEMFQVTIDDNQQYVVTKSISFKDAMIGSRISGTHVDVSLFRFVTSATGSFGIVVTATPPNSSSGEGKYLVTIPISPSVAKGSAQFLEWEAKSSILDLVVQEDSNMVSVTGTESTKNFPRATMVSVQSDGRLRAIDIQDQEITAIASTSRCGVSHSIYARIHHSINAPKQIGPYQSIQVVNLVENGGEATREEIYFQDIPKDILNPSTHGKITSIHAISCSEPKATSIMTPTLNVLVSTSGATTIMIQLSGTTAAAGSKSVALWTAEEALGRIQSTTFVDVHPVIAIHSKVFDNATVSAEEEDERIPSVTERWGQQWKSLQSLIPGKSNSVSSSSAAERDQKIHSRDVSFGFTKRAVVLTSNPSRLFGLDVQRKGKVAWSVLLPNGSSFSSTSTTITARHSLIHSGRHGQHHANEILAVSQIQETKFAENQNPSLIIEWSCIDGVDGNKLRTGVMELDGSKKIVQTMPIRISTGLHSFGLTSLECRQQALLLLDDDSVEMVPPSKVGRESLMAYLREHNLFMHSIDWEKGRLRSMNLLASPDNTTVASSIVGETIFPPDQEKIVSVAYPSPDEVVQSPVTILGDDALLLKYLNPHLAVIVTEATQEYLKGLGSTKDSSGKSPLMSAFLSGGDFSKESVSEKPKKKPLGVTPTEAGESEISAEVPLSTSTQHVPSLFINLVDTVSGKLLHRTSYSHMSESTDGASISILSHNVPVVISENWVLCTFWNHRTKRTEALVLTLHDGMIDKHGITAFKRPQQDTTFSSFESPKPIVLHRTFALSTEVTALGVTQTARGISMKHFLFALGTGQVVTVDRRFLDPRRPSAEPKPAEKVEGLLRYHPILPFLPQNVVSYNLVVEGVSMVKSVAAQVESQSMVLAYGGPDVFFVRVAPSKGFDLLPDNFNRSLLLLIVVALVSLVVAMKRMSNIEILKVTWL